MIQFHTHEVGTEVTHEQVLEFLMEAYAAIFSIVVNRVGNFEAVRQWLIAALLWYSCVLYDELHDDNALVHEKSHKGFSEQHRSNAARRQLLAKCQ